MIHNKNNSKKQNNKRKIQIISILTIVILLISGTTVALLITPEPPEPMEFVTKPLEVITQSVKLQKSIDTNIVLEMPSDRIGKITTDDVFLWGDLEGLDVSDIQVDANRISINIKGEPSSSIAYDFDTMQSVGEIAIKGSVLNEDDTMYTGTVDIIFPQLNSEIQALEYQETYDMELTLTLVNDTFKKAPEQNDIELIGMFENMQVSNIVQQDNVLSFHINGKSNEDSVNGQIMLSGEVLNSGISIHKVFSITEAPQLFSLTPITIEQPYSDVITLRIINDYFSENISADMITLDDGLKGMDIGSVEFIDSTSINVDVKGDFIRDIGYGTILLSCDAIQSGRAIEAAIPIEEPSIELQSDDIEIMAAEKKKEYVLTLYSSGEDFVENTLASDDFVLDGAIGSMVIKDINYVDGYKIELILEGAPKAGKGTISLSAQELGEIKGASCEIEVVESTQIFGTVNLTNFLADMTVSFYDKNDNKMDIQSVQTDQYGIFFIPISYNMLFEEIAYIKAVNDEVELCAPFEWSERINININAFTTLMANAIMSSSNKQDAIQQVYSFLEVKDFGYVKTNYGFIGANDVFSHELFEEQANGDVNGFIDQLLSEMSNGETHPFTNVQELSGQTGGLLDTVVEWGLEKMKDGIIEGAKMAGKEGSLAIFRKAGILKPSNKQMLQSLQKSVNQLSSQVQAMQDKLEYDIKESTIERKLDALSKDLNHISLLYYYYLQISDDIEAEVDAYNEDHPELTIKTDGSQSLIEIDKSELPLTTEFFGRNGEVAKAELDVVINNIITNLNGTIIGKDFKTPLITSYYHLMLKGLPFEHNAAQELYAFMHYVTGIESLGVQLYTSHCLYTGDKMLKKKLDGILDIYGDSIEKQYSDKKGEPLLPDASVFKTTDKNGNIRVKLNYTGKYYTFKKNYLRMKDLIDFANHDYLVNEQNVNLSKKDISDLFVCRDTHYPNYKNNKKFLSKFLPIKGLPDWVYFKTTSKNVGYFTPTYLYYVEFYDMDDNVYRKYCTIKLYNTYGKWITSILTTEG